MRTHTVYDVCEEHGVNRGTVYEWIKRGLPSEGTGRNRRFDLGEVALWMNDNNVTGERGRPREPISEELMKAKVRKENALAERYEMQLAEERGRLVDAAEVEREMITKITFAKNRLLMIPGTVAARLEGLNAPDIEKTLEEEIRNALDQLSRS